MHCLKSMAAEWLKERGYHGLVDECGECGCQVSDLMPCESPGQHCMPAIEVLPDAESAADGNDWMMMDSEWFDPKERLPNRKSKTRVRIGDDEFLALYDVGIFLVYEYNGHSLACAPSFVEAWRYDLPPGSWREGEDQSKLPEETK